jgi:mitochondrial fission protein ELM1
MDWQQEEGQGGALHGQLQVLSEHTTAPENKQPQQQQQQQDRGVSDEVGLADGDKHSQHVENTSSCHGPSFSREAAEQVEAEDAALQQLPVTMFPERVSSQVTAFLRAHQQRLQDMVRQLVAVLL